MLSDRREERFTAGAKDSLADYAIELFSDSFLLEVR
jgi:hypothetical protein